MQNMDSYKLLGFVGILREALNIVFRNGKLMASITIPTLLLYSLLFISNILSTKSLLFDLLIKQRFLLVTSPSSLEFAKLIIGIKEDFKIFIGVESTFILAYLMVSLFTTTATILASSITYTQKNLSFKEFILRIVKSWIRLSFTWFYTTLFGIGYTFLILSILIPLMLLVNGSVIVSCTVATVVVILAMVFYTYLSVVWVLSIVISVIEERCYGIEALGKAGRLVKGMELYGFALNLIFMLVSIALLQGFRLITCTQSVVVQIIIGLVVISFTWVVKMFFMIAYTVLYYQCKKSHGEEIELQGTMEYTKLSTTPSVNEDIP